jgi:hypothetical protein
VLVFVKLLGQFDVKKDVAGVCFIPSRDVGRNEALVWGLKRRPQGSRSLLIRREIVVGKTLCTC